MEKALETLEKNSRVTDFIGDDPEPGWLMNRKEDQQAGWVKFDFVIKGSSSKLKTTVIGDWLTHSELRQLESKRQEFEKSGKSIKDDNTYAPTDFDSY